MPQWDDIDQDGDRPQAVAWDEYAPKALSYWQRLLEEDAPEHELQSFLERNPCFLPGGDDKLKGGGHHGAQYDTVFSQAPLEGLGPDRVPDFMWVNATSASWIPVCIEIERAGKQWFNKDRTPTAHLTQARSQLAEWRAWFREGPNQTIFRRRYLQDRYPHRSLEPLFVLLYGRRKEFESPHSRHTNPEGLVPLRAAMKLADEEVRTLDSLTPNPALPNAVTLKMTANGPVLWAIPSIFRTGPGMADLASKFRNPDQALARTKNWPEGRREYVARRWHHWREVSDSHDDMAINPLLPRYE